MASSIASTSSSSSASVSAVASAVSLRASQRLRTPAAMAVAALRAPSSFSATRAAADDAMAALGTTSRADRLSSQSSLASTRPRGLQAGLPRSRGAAACAGSSARRSRIGVQGLLSPSGALPFSTSTSSSSAAATATSSRRSLLSISGRDTYKLLQGLMTNDVRHLEGQARLLASRNQGQSTDTEDSPPPQKAFYCAFLNPQGRLISTAFLYPHPSTTPEVPHVVVDCHAGNKEALLGFIKRFKLRSKVKIAEMGTSQAEGAAAAAENSDQDASRWDVHQIWKQGEAVPASDTKTQVYCDPRTPDMGYRVLSSAQQPASELATSSYEHHRLTQGVPDGPEELAENHALPLEANLDLMGGVDFRKGCYVGQELTARTHHTGVVRKRIMPVRIYAPEGASSDGAGQPDVGGDLRAPPATTTTSPEGRSRRSKSAGKLLSILPNEAGSAGSGSEPSHVGLASLRLGLLPKQSFAEGGWLTLQGQQGAEGGEGRGSEWRVEPVWPDWWPEDLKAEYQGGGGDAGGEE